MKDTDKKEWAAERRNMENIFLGVTGRATRVLDIEPSYEGELGYTSSRGTIHLAFEHTCMESLNVAERKMFRLGVFAHEMLHQVLTDFTILEIEVRNCKPHERNILSLISNLGEDPAIEHFAPQVFGGELLDALKFMIKHLYRMSEILEKQTSPFGQFGTALIQFGDMGLLKGHFTFPEAKTAFAKAAPIFSDFIEEPNPRTRMDYSKEIMEISRPLWEADAEFAKMMEDFLKSLAKKGKNTKSGSGSPSFTPEREDDGDEVKKKRRKVTFKKVSKEEMKRMKEEGELNEGKIPDEGDIEVLICDEDDEEKDPENGDGTDIPAPKDSKKKDKSKKDKSSGGKSDEPGDDGNEDAEDGEDDGSSGDGKKKDKSKKGKSSGGKSDEPGDDGDEDAEDGEDDGSSGDGKKKDKSKKSESSGGESDEAGDEGDEGDENTEGDFDINDFDFDFDEFNEDSEEDIKPSSKSSSKGSKDASEHTEKSKDSDDSEGEDTTHSENESEELVDDSESTSPLHERATLGGTESRKPRKPSDDLVSDDPETVGLDEDDFVIDNSEYEISDADMKAIEAEIESCFKQLESEAGKEEVDPGETPIENFPIHSPKFGAVSCLNARVQIPESSIGNMNKIYASILSVLMSGINTLTTQLKRIFQNDHEEKMYHTSGKIDINRVYGSRVTSRVFDRRRLPSEKADLAIVILVDESGSMSNWGKAESAKMCCIALAEVFGRLNIPVYIIGFTADQDRYKAIHYHYITWKNTPNDRIKLLNITARSNNFDGYSIRYAGEVLKKKQATHKLLIVLSDGEPACNAYSGNVGVADTKDAIRDNKKHMSVLGVAIGNNDTDTIHYMYEKDFLHVNKVEDLFVGVGKKIQSIIKGWD